MRHAAEEQNERDDLARGVRATAKLARTVPTIDRMRAIVTSRSAARVDGLLVDLWSASAVVRAFDALNETNRLKLASMPVRQMVQTALRLL